MEQDRVIVIGAGMGGLAAAIRCAASGLKVTVLESAPTPGGKARAIPSPATGGPTAPRWTSPPTATKTPKPSAPSPDRRKQPPS